MKPLLIFGIVWLSIAYFVSLTFALLLIGIIIAILIAGIHRKAPNTPPSPSGALPWFGHLMQLGERTHITYREWWLKYGDLLYVQLGDQACVLVSSPALHKEIYGTNGRACLSRPPLSVRDLTGKVLGGPGVLWSAGADWRAHRAFVNASMLSPTKVDEVVPLMYDEVQRCVRGFKLAAQADANGDVEIMARLFQVAINSLTIVALGHRLFDVDKSEGLAYRDAIATIFDVAGEPRIEDYVRVLRRFLPSPKSFVKCETALRLVYGAVTTTLEERARARAENKSAAARTILDEVLDMEEAGDGSGRLSHKEMLRSVAELINAGGETTTAVLTWACVAAAEHPQETQRVIDELDKVIGSREFVSPADFEHLPLFDAWLKETVRVFPLARVTFPRITTEDITVGSYTIPKDTMILIHRQALMNHPDFWREPEKFSIDRFLPGGEAGPDVKDAEWAFVFFGSGPRYCPAKHMAFWEVRMTIANLLLHFKISYSPREPRFDPVHHTETKLTTRPKGARLTLNMKERQRPRQ